ncbi:MULTISPECIES: amidohydrolase family protein [Rhodopseudomonas]|uniref:amidohydrolase family protein n=1 Tax=Rhodopseudomonas TaxID=1073 RepID=UPI0009B94B88|nr:MULTISPECIES: amidohydrolase family protein [Rhodopseudomonas]MDF3809355.1 amidohydrolase family protein [Rhodopseudomonas sp. BAL398]WOK16972.1 amidohydrolase family protein [Rhodopseudomonas sp. BAL398]
MFDVHAHLLPQRYIQALKQWGAALPLGPPPRADDAPRRTMAPWSDSASDLESRLSLMSEAGVKTQFLSPGFSPYQADEAAGIGLAQVINDEFAAFVAKAPSALKAFASLPLPHLDASLKEMARALDDLKFSGVTLNCACGKRSVAAPYFEPIFAELNRRGAVLFLHPCINGICSHFVCDWKLETAAGPVLEDTLIGLHFIAANIPSRFPNMKIIVPHLGGALPAMLARLDNQLSATHALAERPSDAARRMWYDSCIHGSIPVLKMGAEILGADRILVGSDYPFLTSYESYAETVGYIRNCGLTEQQMTQIFEGNVRALLAA